MILCCFEVHLASKILVRPVRNSAAVKVAAASVLVDFQPHMSSYPDARMQKVRDHADSSYED